MKIKAALEGLDWIDNPLCAEVDPELFFPEPGTSAQHAKSICGRCPLLAPCLAHALNHGEEYGVWGGTTERDRRVIQRRQRDQRRAAEEAA